jgi:hypothetical protein
MTNKRILTLSVPEEKNPMFSRQIFLGVLYSYQVIYPKIFEKS